MRKIEEGKRRGDDAATTRGHAVHSGNIEAHQSCGAHRMQPHGASVPTASPPLQQPTPAVLCSTERGSPNADLLGITVAVPFKPVTAFPTLPCADFLLDLGFWARLVRVSAGLGMPFSSSAGSAQLIPACPGNLIREYHTSHRHAARVAIIRGSATIYGSISVFCPASGTQKKTTSTCPKSAALHETRP
jgi:hypothetical protein